MNREQATKPEVNGQQPAPQPAAAAPAQQAAGEPQGEPDCRAVSCSQHPQVLMMTWSSRQLAVLSHCCVLLHNSSPHCSMRYHAGTTSAVCAAKMLVKCREHGGFALLLCLRWLHAGRLPCAEDSFTRQLRQLEPLVAGTQPAQQQQEQDVSQHGPGSYHPSRADSSDMRYGQAAYSVASYDDNGTDSAASSPRSRSSWAPSVGSHLPPSRWV